MCIFKTLQRINLNLYTEQKQIGPPNHEFKGYDTEIKVALDNEIGIVVFGH